MSKSRFVFLILCLATVVVFFSACAGDNGHSGNGGTAADGYRDMEGQEFYFLGSIIPKNERDYTDEDYKNLSGATLTIEQEAMADHAVVVENKLNCKIIMNSSLAYSNSANFAAAYAAGELKCDFIHSEIQFARSLFVSKVVAPISELDAIDANNSEKWGNSDLLMSTTYNGELFGFPCIGSNYYPYALVYYGVLLCKNDTYAIFDIDATPQEMVENGDWTFDNFKALLPQVSGYNGESKVYAFVHSGLAYSAVYANGGSFVVQKRGKYVFGFTQQNATAALEWVKSIFRLTDSCSEIDQQEGATISGFCDGNIVFLLTNGNRVFKEISAGTADYSWIPFPYGPNAEYGTTVSAYSMSDIDSAVSVIKNEKNQRTQDSAYVMNELFEPTEYFGLTGYDDYLYRYYFDDDDEASFNVYKTQGLQRHYNYSYEFSDAWEEFGEYVNNAVTGSGSVSNYMSAVEDAVNEALDKTMNGK